MDRENYDVMVCGCGVAGFCAAIAAARTGAKVAMAEKYAMPGGILTVGGNTSIDEFNNPHRHDAKNGTMVIKGIPWEFIKRLEREGYALVPDMEAPFGGFYQQYGVKVNTLAAANLMDEMLLEEGVDIYYDQPVVRVNVQNLGSKDKRVESAEILTKSGLKLLKSKVFVDATGDGDFSAYAGADFEVGDENHHVQPGTLRYYPCVDTPENDKICGYGDNENHIHRMNPVDSNAVTMANIEARRILKRQMDEKSQKIMAVAPFAAPREGRRILGKSYMTVDDYISGKIFPDSVCFSYWFVDIHRENQPSYIEYITNGLTPTIRLSAMEVRGFANLMTAGRNISTDRAANSSLRVKASCMAMGQSAGTAAAIASLEYDGNLDNVDVEKVKIRLENQGAVVPTK